MRGRGAWLEIFCALTFLLTVIFLLIPLFSASSIADSENHVLQQLQSFSKNPTQVLPELTGYRIQAQKTASGDGFLAWPMEYGRTGNACFYLKMPDQLFESRNDRTHYSGTENPPGEKATTFANGDAQSKFFSKDGQEWRRVAE